MVNGYTMGVSLLCVFIAVILLRLIFIYATGSQCVLYADDFIPQTETATLVIYKCAYRGQEVVLPKICYQQIQPEVTRFVDGIGNTYTNVRLMSLWSILCAAGVLLLAALNIQM